MSRFFINRPIFSIVLAIIVVIAGLISITRIPIEQYPNIAPPSISINTSLPGSSAKTLEDSVTQIIEQSLNGLDNLRYFSSQSDSSGNVSITLTFEPGTDPDVAQMQVQNKIQAAIPLLPQSVQQQGITVNKSNSNFLLVIGIYSDNESYSNGDLGDILLNNIKDKVSRVNGVGRINLFGNPHAMRIWLNPEKLIKYKLTASEVIKAIREQNIDISAGQVGGLPAIKGQQINAIISAQSKFTSVNQFENIIIRAKKTALVRLKDVAKVNIGSLSYNVSARYKGKPASGMAVILASGANALKTAKEVKATIEEIKPTLPSDVHLIYPYDSTPFIKLSIKNVVQTLFEAIILVFIVMYIFLQNFRATLIPTIAVPIVILGTFATLLTFGYSINTLTMFAMVISIGLLVDDAIVVVENVERIMHEENLTPKQATLKSMQQITGALIGIGVVLSAIFIPMAFFEGASGAIYRQFAITIISSMTLSVLVALILSPTLCSLILKKSDLYEKKNKILTIFEKILNRSMRFYHNSSNYIIKKSLRFIFVYIFIICGALFLLRNIPTSFLPTEDQGVLYLMVNAPAGSSSERTTESLKKVEDYFLNKEGSNVDHLFTVSGFSFAGMAQNAGFGFVGLKDWSQRSEKDQSVMAISDRAMKTLSQVKDSMIFTFFPPAIRELGNSSGFDLQLLDEGGIGYEQLVNSRNMLLGIASQNPIFTGVRPNGLQDSPQLNLNINRSKAMAIGLNNEDINQTISTAFGSTYVNDFIENGRIKKVYIQGDKDYRMFPKDIGKWYLRNNQNEMVSFDSILKYNWGFGATKLERFNGVPSFNIQGSGATGVSSGDAMKELENIIKNKLPKGVGYAWSGTSYEEKVSESKTTILYAISILFIFLCLAALYESWSLPFAIIMTAPFGIFGAVLFAYLFKIDNDIYFQISILTTIGLSAKNAILVVEFIKNANENGKDLIDSALDAIKIRFRPIMMTSIAFIFGITPMILAKGAGSVSQNSIGIAIVGGMIFATFFATFFIPMFYVIIMKIKKKYLNEA